MPDSQNYYGRPAIKAPPFDRNVARYIHLGGIAGAAQIIAAVAHRSGGRHAGSVVRNARYLALAGATAGPLFLIADLKTPDRWYNMLRIFRRTSPMSIGSWMLTGFGLLTGVTALGQFAKDRWGRKRLAAKAGDAAQLPASILGAGMATYTAALLSATSIPRWAAAPRALAVQFGSSAMAGGAAALSLLERIAGRAENCVKLDRLAMLSVLTEAVSSMGARQRVQAEAGDDQVSAVQDGASDERLGMLLGQVVPLACFGINTLRRRPSTTLSVVGALSILAGGALSRAATIEAGKTSAGQPDEYLQFAGSGRSDRHSGA